MKKTISSIFLLILMFASLTGCKHEQTEDIYIIYTNDVASVLDGDIGYAGVKGFKNEIEREHQYVALVDAGDFFDGEISKNSKGRSIVDVMNAVGYDAAVVGNQEFSIGLEALSENIGQSDFAYLSCNIRYTGNKKNVLDNVKPYIIKNYGGTKIAFIGVTTPETLIPGKPAYDAILEDGTPAYDFYGADEGLELYEQVQKTVNKVRRKADYVVLLAHLGSFGTMEGYSSYEVIGHTEGIDIVIDGHAHATISGEAVINKNGDEVLLTSTGEKLQNVGIMQIHPDRSITSILYPAAYEKDEAVEALVQSILTQ